MPVTLKTGQHHTFLGPQGDFVSVTNESGNKGQYEFTYKKKSSQTYNIGGFATENHNPKEFPVTVTNTGKPTLSVGVA